jgi:hypothetical protein
MRAGKRVDESTSRQVDKGRVDSQRGGSWRALPALLLLFACASGDGFIDDQVHDCESGPIAIRAGIDSSGSSALGGSEVHNVLVEVANNSDGDVVVDSVRVEPQQRQDFEITGRSIRPNETVVEGGDHVFEVPLTIRPVDTNRRLDPRRGFSGVIDVSVSVGLSDGETYRCAFRVRVP